jgi:hypothetical protein
MKKELTVLAHYSHSAIFFSSASRRRIRSKPPAPLVLVETAAAVVSLRPCAPPLFHRRLIPSIATQRRGHIPASFSPREAIHHSLLCSSRQRAARRRQAFDLRSPPSAGVPLSSLDGAPPQEVGCPEASMHRHFCHGIARFLHRKHLSSPANPGSPPV